VRPATTFAVVIAVVSRRYTHLGIHPLKKGGAPGRIRNPSGELKIQKILVGVILTRVFVVGIFLFISLPFLFAQNPGVGVDPRRRLQAGAKASASFTRKGAAVIQGCSGR
jgi:hypothetical protein